MIFFFSSSGKRSFSDLLNPLVFVVAVQETLLNVVCELPSKVCLVGEKRKPTGGGQPTHCKESKRLQLKKNTGREHHVWECIIKTENSKNY